MEEFFDQLLETLENARYRIEEGTIEGTVSGDMTNTMELLAELIEEVENHSIDVEEELDEEE